MFQSLTWKSKTKEGNLLFQNMKGNCAFSTLGRPTLSAVSVTSICHPFYPPNTFRVAKSNWISAPFRATPGGTTYFQVLMPEGSWWYRTRTDKSRICDNLIWETLFWQAAILFKTTRPNDDRVSEWVSWFQSMFSCSNMEVDWSTARTEARAMYIFSHHANRSECFR